jgi:predicted MFS family arabinose efflux permease
MGVYRLWRDSGFAVGALLSGIVADLLGTAASIWVVAALTAASGVVVAVRMYETRRRDEVLTAGRPVEPSTDG